MRSVRHRDRAKNVLVVFAHPRPDSFIGAVAERAVTALRGAGHEVRTQDLYAEQFDPAVSKLEWRSLTGKTDEPSLGLETSVANLRWCEALVFVYPTWFGAQPAILKGWFDRVWVAGVAYRLPANGGFLRPMLRNVRAITVLTSHGSPKRINMLQGEPGKRVILRGLRTLCHPLCRTRWLAFYGNDLASHADRTAFLATVSRKMARS